MLPPPEGAVGGAGRKEGKFIPNTGEPEPLSQVGAEAEVCSGAKESMKIMPLMRAGLEGQLREGIPAVFSVHKQGQGCPGHYMRACRLTGHVKGRQ